MQIIQENKYNNWNIQKISIEKNKQIRTFREWEIWYISMWENIWFEQD